MINTFNYKFKTSAQQKQHLKQCQKKNDKPHINSCNFFHKGIKSLIHNTFYNSPSLSFFSSSIILISKAKMLLSPYLKRPFSSLYFFPQLHCFFLLLFAVDSCEDLSPESFLSFSFKPCQSRGLLSDPHVAQDSGPFQSVSYFTFQQQ